MVDSKTLRAPTASLLPRLRPRSLLIAGSLALAACTTTMLETVEGDAGPGDVATGTDAATPDAVDAGPDGATTEEAKGGGQDGGWDAEAGSDASGLVDCGAPQGLVFKSPLGPYCPFQAGSVFGSCAVGEHCCEYAEDAGLASTCSAGQTACAPEIALGFDWRCDESNDCPAEQVCCFAGEITPHRQCAGHYYASPSVHTTACRVGACAAGETRTCGSQADCPVGTTCTGMRHRGKHFGFCKP